MEWKIKISNRARYQIIFDYDPLVGTAVVKGMYKELGKNTYICIANKLLPTEDVIVEFLRNVKSVIYDIILEMDNKVMILETIEGALHNIKEIEINR